MAWKPPTAPSRSSVFGGSALGGVHAVRDVDLEIKRGERRAVSVPTAPARPLFNVISGEFPPTTGEVELFVGVT